MTQKDIMENCKVVLVKVLIKGNDSDGEGFGEQMNDQAENVGNFFNWGYQVRKPTRAEAKEALKQLPEDITNDEKVTDL